MTASKRSEKGRLRAPSSQEEGALAAAVVAAAAAAAVAAVTAAAVGAAVSTATAAEDQDNDQDQPQAVIIVIAHFLVHLTCHALHYPMRERAKVGLTIPKMLREFEIDQARRIYELRG